MELILIHEIQMPIKILNHERHVTYICVNKGGLSLLHIVPFCEGPNEKLEGFAKQKQCAIFAM
jgi:hypothetical protein